MKKILMLLLLVPSLVWAQSKRSAPEDEFHLLLEPVIGYQIIERSYPYNHTTGMLLFGGRLVLGSQRLAGEFLYTHGSSSETFSNPQQTVETTRDAFRAGPRTIVPLEQWVSLIFRAGMQGYKDEFSIRSASGTVTSTSGWKYNPYTGVGLILRVFSGLTLDLSGTYIFNGDIETSAGFRLYI